MIRVGSSEDHGLALDAIQIDGGTQSRATLNQHVVDDYAEAIKAGATFPPIVVFYDGKKHWLADGFHRFHAYQKAGKAKVAADIRQGTRRDAILHGVGANETHGLRRTRDDKRRAVLTLLNDAEWAAKPETWIAETCRVSRTLVRAVLAEQPHLVEKQDRSTVREVTRGGTTYSMQTANIGKTGDAEKEEITPQTVVQQGIDGGAEPEKSAEEIIPPRNIVAEILTLWAEANEVERDEIRAIINSDFGSSTETRNSHLVGRASGAQCGLADHGAVAALAPECPSAATPAEAVAESQAPRPSATAKVSSSEAPPPPGATEKAEAPSSSPSASAALHCPANPAVADGQPSTPTPDALAAGQGAMPGSIAKSGDAVSNFINPRCQHPGICPFANSREACHDCLMDWSKRPKDEQIRLWAEANEAARASA